MKKAAESTVGHVHRSRSGRLVLSNMEVAALSKKQRKLEMDAGNWSQDLKKERNKLMHRIRTIQRDEAARRLDKIAEEIEKAPDSAKMCMAASGMRKRKQQAVVVHSVTGETLAKNSEKGQSRKGPYREGILPQCI
eukprot:scpid85537/ scgid35117/ 